MARAQIGRGARRAEAGSSEHAVQERSSGLWAAGLWALAGLTLARWLTQEPYLPVFLPYDLTAVLAWTGCVALAVRISGVRRHGGMVAVALALPLLVAWAVLLATAPVSATGRWAARGALLVACLLLAGRRRPAPAPVVSALGVGLGAGLVVARGTGAGWLVLPAVALALAGLAPRGRTLPARVSVPGVAALLLLTSFTAPPGSASRVETRLAAAARPGPAVVLIVLDTLRRDRLSLYGYGRATSPALSRFAERALVFDAATATSSWTLPSHASIFTGLAPRAHGAHGFRGGAPHGNAHPLEERFETLAERARAHGIATAAIAANHFYLSPRYGLQQGFDSYWVHAPRAGLRMPGVDRLAHWLQPRAVERVRWPYYRAEEITDRVLDWLSARGDESFFLFVNYMDVHAPNHGSPDPRVPKGDEQSPAEADFDLNRVPEGVSLPEPVRRHLENEYDREMLDLDRQLGRLLARLREGPLGTRTTVIVTSDHGEYLGEHQLIDHSRDLHEEVIGVPLLVAGPGIEPGRRSEPVSIAAIYDTALARLGVEGVGPGVLGPAPSLVTAEWHASEHALHLDPRYRGRFDRDLWVIRQGPYKLFADDRDRVVLYDLSRDPHEQRDLASALPELRRSLQARLDHWKARHPEAAAGVGPRQTPELSPEQLDQLRALGYAE